jgi:hypothetical protein
MLDDAEKQVGKQYGSSTLLKTLNWYSNMFTKKQTAADQLRVCSTHAQIMYEKADVLNKNNESSDNNFYSPAELMDSTIFNLYKISDY